MRLFHALFTSVVFIVVPLTAHAEKLTLSTWNMEWLTINPNHNVYEGKRSNDDFSALKGYFERLNADVIAFQEVDSIDAFKRVSSSDYSVILSDRDLPQYHNHQFSDINQYTGFAIRNNVPFSDPKDIDLYGRANHKLRFASYVILYPDSATPVHVLSLHLKAGCVGKFYSHKETCQTLLAQGKSLNRWIKEREKQGQEYVIMGDFNHNLSFKGDWLWQEFNQGLKQKPELATRNTQALCKVRKRNNASQLHQFRSVIDHMIVSPKLQTTQPKQMVYKDQDALNYHLSDHCPIVSQFNW
ncbi:endonuclease/exonuclease/phosphatase family protein [Vibrio diazotrophicus]|uniref:endonuclease/exonuclease/phosphatase family protein n=1 Tax=Vibrio diazotrophicus TaxID=685 RepID=UPI00158DD6FE|nr:endonuclease/exonuclease/phosphatase family protein [Vibrio diazotrophicus]